MMIFIFGMYCDLWSLIYHSHFQSQSRLGSVINREWGGRWGWKREESWQWHGNGQPKLFCFVLLWTQGESKAIAIIDVEAYRNCETHLNSWNCLVKTIFRANSRWASVNHLTIFRNRCLLTITLPIVFPAHSVPMMQCPRVGETWNGRWIANWVIY